MTMDRSISIDPEEIADHLRFNPDEAFEVLAYLANRFDGDDHASKWVERAAALHSGSLSDSRVRPFLLVLAEALAQAEAV